jgi:hypothetical protein
MRFHYDSEQSATSFYHVYSVLLLLATGYQSTGFCVLLDVFHIYTEGVAQSR